MYSDKSKLFEGVPEAVYDRIYVKLMAMREAHPSYRDDQLLIRLMCDLEPYSDLSSGE